MAARPKVRVAIAGVGNCASSLVQGVQHYAKDEAEGSVGLVRPVIGPYRASDIEFSAAFDVCEGKVGLDLSLAVLAPPNNTLRFAAVPILGVPVQRGPTMDGIGAELATWVRESSEPVADVASVLRASQTDVLVCYLPVGSEQAVRWYAQQAIDAGCGFVNCIPVFIASDPAWRARFEAHHLPLIGDDIKSQLGATVTHRALAALFRERGVKVDRTYQLNFGGNADFLNMRQRDRLVSKKQSKTSAVTSALAEQAANCQVHVGPSDFVPWLEDRKCCYIRMEGRAFGGAAISLEVRMEVWDSPNSAGVVIDAVRCAKLAMDAGVGGALLGPSACFMKSPPVTTMSEREASLRTDALIRECARLGALRPCTGSTP